MANRSSVVDKMKNLFNRKSRKKSAADDIEIIENDQPLEETEDDAQQKLQSEEISRVQQMYSKMDGALCSDFTTDSQTLSPTIPGMGPKRSSFQITSVISKRTETIDDCYESADDLDDTPSGDNIDATSDEVSVDDSADQLSVGKSRKACLRSASCLLPIPPDLKIARQSQDRSFALSIPHSNSFSCNSSTSKTSSDMYSSFRPLDNRSRFRIVKLRNAKPFAAGRWTCIDFLDSPATSYHCVPNSLSNSSYIQKYEAGGKSNQATYLEVASSGSGLQRAHSMQNIYASFEPTCKGSYVPGVTSQATMQCSLNNSANNSPLIIPTIISPDMENQSLRASIQDLLLHSSVHNNDGIPVANKSENIVNVLQLSPSNVYQTQSVDLRTPTSVLDPRGLLGGSTSFFNFDIRRSVSAADIRIERDAPVSIGTDSSDKTIAYKPARALDMEEGIERSALLRSNDNKLDANWKLSRALDSQASLLSDFCEDCNEDMDDGLLRINSKITEAMDLVKRHLTYTVNEEINQLQGIIQDLTLENQRLREENILLRSTLSAPKSQQ